jgi:O-glycosyl hydrolase
MRRAVVPVRKLALTQALAAAGLTAMTVVGTVSGPPRVTELPALAPVVSLAAVEPVTTVRPDPSYVGQPFEGWGTSLVWFANATGGYPDEIRDRLADMVFGEDGLNLNIARYNIGGGNAPDVPDYLRAGGAVPGWWKAPAGTTRADKDWWDPDNPAHWDLNADATQRWWVDKIKSRITKWETFSNSPPYFQTVSGYVSGGFDSTKDQIRPETIDEFATYLVRVTRELEKAHGIRVATLAPLNEPNTNFWGTTIGPDGKPTAKQEGAHAGPASQQALIRAVAEKLALEGRSTKISAMDETNPGVFITNWNAYENDARALVEQLNVHTYGTSQRTAVRDIAKAENKPLWMSEVEGTWGASQNFTSMAPGLGIARRMVEDLRELEPSAWVFWQPIEDIQSQKPRPDKPLGTNWGSIQMPFNCTATDTLATCPIQTNTKFNTIRNLTHYIRPGDHLLKTGDSSSVAALSPKNELKVVYVNDGTAAKTVSLDLSQFARVEAGATVTPIVTTASGALVPGTPVAITDDSALVQVPAESVTTLVVNGKTAPGDGSKALIQPGHVYRLQGAQSGRNLTAAAATGTAGLAIKTDNPTSPQQLWTLRSLGNATSDRSRYVVGTATGDRLLAVVDGALRVVPGDPTADPAPSAQWVLSTTGNRQFTLVNVGSRRLIDVGGQATADGSSVGVWLPNAADNQLWKITDQTVLRVQPVEVFTTPGVAPTMPSTVVPVYTDGARGTLPVTWTLPAGSSWGRGKVTVSGVATDSLGKTHAVTGTVFVDTLVSTQPGSAKTYVGGAPTLPATVTAVSKRGYTVQRPATWDAVAPALYAQVGVVTVTGTADAGDGTTLPATAQLTVTEPVLENAALSAGTLASATFTEPGYSASGVVNGALTEKAWSNWKGSNKNASDTLTVTLPRARDVAKVVTRFYRDGTTDSYAQTLRVEAKTDTGDWVAVSGLITVPSGAPAPVVEVPIPASAGASRAVRVVMNAYPNRHMIVSEIEVFAKTAG